MNKVQDFAVQIAIKRMKEAEQRLTSLTNMRNHINQEIANAMNVLDVSRTDFSNLMNQSGIK